MRAPDNWAAEQKQEFINAPAHILVPRTRQTTTSLSGYNNNKYTTCLSYLYLGNINNKLAAQKKIAAPVLRRISLILIAFLHQQSENMFKWISWSNLLLFTNIYACYKQIWLNLFITIWHDNCFVSKIWNLIKIICMHFHKYLKAQSQIMRKYALILFHRQDYTNFAVLFRMVTNTSK